MYRAVVWQWQLVSCECTEPSCDSDSLSSVNVLSRRVTVTVCQLWMYTAVEWQWQFVSCECTEPSCDSDSLSSVNVQSRRVTVTVCHLWMCRAVMWQRQFVSCELTQPSSDSDSLLSVNVLSRRVTVTVCQFNVPFQHKHGHIRDESRRVNVLSRRVTVTVCHLWMYSAVVWQWQFVNCECTEPSCDSDAAVAAADVDNTVSLISVTPQLSRLQLRYAFLRRAH